MLMIATIQAIPIEHILVQLPLMVSILPMEFGMIYPSYMIQLCNNDHHQHQLLELILGMMGKDMDESMKFKVIHYMK